MAQLFNKLYSNNLFGQILSLHPLHFAQDFLENLGFRRVEDSRFHPPAVVCLRKICLAWHKPEDKLVQEHIFPAETLRRDLREVCPSCVSIQSLGPLNSFEVKHSS